MPRIWRQFARCRAGIRLLGNSIFDQRMVAIELGAITKQGVVSASLTAPKSVIT
jgi:hypothetical protein